jgi:FAD/FMN-containing dehydrogenase
VVAAVEFARTNESPLAVRGGGHSPAGYGTVDGGLVVDLSNLKTLDVDPQQRVAWAEAGLTWGEYNARTHAHGLATPGGDVAAVGIAGLTLGGGMGWLMRKHGMTIDNLLAVDIVTADGRLLTASETETTRPLLGAPRRRRQLRDRDPLPVSPPPRGHGPGRRHRVPRHARGAAGLRRGGHRGTR